MVGRPRRPPVSRETKHEHYFAKSLFCRFFGFSLFTVSALFGVSSSRQYDVQSLGGLLRFAQLMTAADGSRSLPAWMARTSPVLTGHTRRPHCRRVAFGPPGPAQWPTGAAAPSFTFRSSRASGIAASEISISVQNTSM